MTFPSSSCTEGHDQISTQVATQLPTEAATASPPLLDVHALLAAASTPEVTLSLAYAPNLWYETDNPCPTGRVTFWVFKTLPDSGPVLAARSSFVSRPSCEKAWCTEHDAATAVDRFARKLVAQTAADRLNIAAREKDAPFIKETEGAWTIEQKDIRGRDFGRPMIQRDTGKSMWRRQSLMVCTCELSYKLTTDDGSPPGENEPCTAWKAGEARTEMLPPSDADTERPPCRSGQQV